MDKFCFCGSGKRTNNCHPHINADSLVASVIKLYSSWDRFAEKEKKEHNIKFFCDRKCSSCCNNYFYIAEKEYLTIYCFIKLNLGNKYLVSKILQAQQYMIYIQDKFPEEYKKLNTFIPPNYTGSIESYYNDNLKCFNVQPCIFLNQSTGLCDIYPVRPYICRLHGITYPYNACPKILNTPNYQSKMINLNAFPDKDSFTFMDFIKISDLTKPIYRRSFPIADFFASILPRQLELKSDALEYSYRKSMIDYYSLVLQNHIQRSNNT